MTQRGKAAGRALAAALAAMLALGGCGKALSADSALARTTTTATAQATSRSLDSWRDENIYFILTDRFSNGDKSNDANVNVNDPNAFHGGDFQGIINKLSYIKALGATTIWITPIQQNKPDSLVGKYWGYHGYWITDWESIDKRLGTDAKFAELVNAAHGMGIKVMLDVVCNHMGYDAPLTKDPAKTDWFHHNGDVKDWNNQWQLENCDVAGLPDMNTENPAVMKYMDDMWSSWITRTHVDGFRVDTVKHVPIPFWTQFNKAIHAHAGAGFLTIGEVLQGDPGYLANYQRQGGFDSLFDYPMYFTIADVFARGQSMRLLGNRLAQDGAYNDATLLAPILDNHDLPRFLTVANNDERRLRLALALLYSMRGIPTIYMGTETGMKGGDDPDNRKDMDFTANASLHDYVAQLMHLRLELPALRRGRMLEMWTDDQVYGYSRLMGQDEVMVFLNNSDQPQTRDVQMRAESGTADGATFTDRLGGGSVTVTNRHIHIELAPKQARIFAPGGHLSLCRPGESLQTDAEAQKKKSPVCALPPRGISKPKRRE